MFERYTETARRVIFFAREEAIHRGSPTIESEHLLLGLLRDNRSSASRLLRARTSLEWIAKQIQERSGATQKVAAGADTPLSGASMRVLSYAAEEADGMKDNNIRASHLLLGLLREENCFAAQILREQGFKPDQIREEIAQAPKESFKEIKIGYIPDESVLRHVLRCVTIQRPETCVIDAEVEVGPETIIEPFVQLLGRTRVGSGCRIRSFSVIENCTLGDGVLIRQSCVLEDSAVADGAQIGPFAHLRPGSEIGEDAHVGNFVETKNAKLGKGAKASHLTYLGDAEIGEGANIGAGTITCNYDGVNKHMTRIGKGAFVGSDSTLVAPITIGDGAYVGAGSCITKDVPADALAVARGRQITKEGWAATRRARRPPKHS